MRTLRKFPSWLPRKLERLVFSLFALVWTASLGGCNPVGDDIKVRYGGPDIQDTAVAKYGIPTPKDTLILRYGSPTPVDTMKAWYGAPTPIDTVKPLDPVVARYGIYMPTETTDRFLGKYGAPMPIDTVIAKYGVPAGPDTTKTTYSPAPPTEAGEA